MTKDKQRLSGPKPKLLHLKHLKTEPHTFQFRESETTEAHVRDLVDALKAGKTLDPMTVWMRGEGDYVIVDGHHRHAAYKRFGYSRKVPVTIHECDEATAITLALSENNKPKLPMTKVERENAAWRLVCSDLGFSKAETVKASGVSNGTVGNMRKVRKELEEEGEPLPETWWQALRARKGLSRTEVTDDMVEAMIEARANELDDKIGKELGRIGNLQWEALAIVLDRRLEHHPKACLADWLSGNDESEDEEDFPF